MNRIFRLPTWMLALLVLGVAPALAQTGYPDRPVKIIVPIGPGGSYDLVGRQLADALSKRMGQTFVVENKPGAGTVVGTQAASQSEPDGYTLVVGGLSNMAFNSALYSKLAYDPRKDFVPVALIYKFGYVMVARKDLPHDKLADIVAAAKANPGSISVATAGVGTGQHLVAAAFMKAAGIKLLEVPYKGSPPAFTDLLAGRIDMFFDSNSAGLPYVQSGQAKGIAVLSSKRSPLAPDVPTMSEAGVPGLDVDFLARDIRARQNPARGNRKTAPRNPRLIARTERSFREKRRRGVGSRRRQARWFRRLRIRDLDQTDPRSRHQAGLGSYFTRSISSIAPAGARTLPSWMT